MSYLYDYLDPSALLDSPARVFASLSRSARFDSIAGSVLRMLIIGALAAGVRRLYNFLSTHIERILFPTAYIHHTDPAYQWIRTWLATDQAAQAQIRDFQLFTEEWRSVRKRAGAITVKEHNATWTAKDIIGQVLPSYPYEYGLLGDVAGENAAHRLRGMRRYEVAIRIKHNGNYLWIRPNWASFARTGYRNVDHWQIKTIAFRPNILKDFLIAAHQNFFAKEDKELLIFHAKRINPTWQNPVSRPARPWSSVILPGSVKEDLLRDVQKFLSEKEMSWYAARGIPHRRGYLFAGEPGSGKTTLTTAIASKLRLDIYVINPSQRGMDDAKLSKLFRDCPAKSIILIEDIDCIFPRGRGRNAAIVNGVGNGNGNGADEVTDHDDAAIDVVPDAPSSPMVGGSHDLAPSTVTLSGLLNAIDGVSSQEGCILVASTNHQERLDPALTRAGRFDVRLTFSDAIPSQARALFLHFYPLADFQQTEHADDTSREKASLGISSQDDLDALADAFAAAVFPTGKAHKVGGKPDVGVSMAALQGYLLQHKEDPRKAVDDAGEWARGLEKDKEAKKAIGRSALGAPPVTPVAPSAGGAVGKVPLRKKVLKKNNAASKSKQAAAAAEASEDAGEGSGESVAEE